MQHLAQFRQRVAQLIGCCLVAYTDRLVDQHLVAFCPVDDFEIDELGVRYRDQRAVESAELGRTDSDGFDRPHLGAEGTEIADADGLVDIEDHTTDQVFERWLDRQRDRKTAYAEPASMLRTGIPSSCPP